MSVDPSAATTVNLTKLSETRAAMTTGEYGNDGSIKRDIWSGSLFVAGADREADSAGLVATHNAADVLIEVARTAKVLEAVEAQWREVGSAAVGALDSARRQHREALAKVSL